MSYNTLLQKVQNALKSVVDDLGIADYSVLTGQEDDEMQRPYIICACSNTVEETVKDTGVYNVEARVIVCSSADDTTLAAHQDTVGQVFDAILDTGIEATLSAAVDDFHCYDVFDFRSEQEYAERSHKDVLIVNMIVCPSDIS